MRVWQERGAVELDVLLVVAEESEASPRLLKATVSAIRQAARSTR